MIESEIMANGAATSNRTSVPLQIDDLTNYGIQVTFSGGAGDLAGDLSLEVTNDKLTWITVTGSQQTVVASANHYWNVEGASYKWVRAQWVYASGTGNISMNAVIKEPRNRY